MSKGLIAALDADLSATLKVLLTAACGSGVTGIDEARTGRDAQEKVQASEVLKFVVVESSLPSDPIAPPDISGKTCLQLIACAKNKHPNVECIVFGPGMSVQVRSRLRAMKSVRILNGDAGALLKDVQAQVQAVCRDGAAIRRELLIDVRLDNERSHYRAFITKKSVYDNTIEEPISINLKLMADLCGLSDDIQAFRKADWERRLQEIGTSVFRELFDTFNMGSHIEQGLNSVDGDITKVRLRFEVSPDLHPVAFEALFGGRYAKDEFWMLKMPIYRQLPNRPERAPHLFDIAADNEPLNILVIESPAQGVPNVPGAQPEKGLPELKEIRQECSEVVRLCNQKKKAGPRKPYIHLHRCKPDPFPARSLKRLLDVLDSQPWHIIHYAGHSYYHVLSKKGYLFLPGPQDSYSPVALSVSEFAKHLKNNQFVYLSSCSSTSEGFVHQLAKEGQTNAVLGYRWQIDDTPARHFANAFYSRLLSGDRSRIEEAFLHARTVVHDAFRDNLAWASAILLSNYR